MALIVSIKNSLPKLGKKCFVAPTATLVGQVSCLDNCSFWYNSVVRGDVGMITIGNHTNVQDGAVLHCTYQKHDLKIGNHVSIGHRAIVHGCTVGNNVLIGMGAIIMDGAIIEDNAIVAAGAVVLEGTLIRSGEIFAGVPAKLVKKTNQKKLHQSLKKLSLNYVMYSSWIK